MATDSNTATVPSRLAALEMWLEAVNAKLLWSSRIPNVGVVECYSANGRIFHVQRCLRDAGFDVLVPASDKNSIAETLDAAARFITTGSTQR